MRREFFYVNRFFSLALVLFEKLYQTLDTVFDHTTNTFKYVKTYSTGCLISTLVAFRNCTQNDLDIPIKMFSIFEEMV